MAGQVVGSLAGGNQQGNHGELDKQHEAADSLAGGNQQGNHGSPTQ